MNVVNVNNNIYKIFKYFHNILKYLLTWTSENIICVILFHPSPVYIESLKFNINFFYI